MKKLSKNTRSNLLNIGVLVVTLALVLIISARGGDMGDVWTAVRSAEPFWIAAALASWGVFLVFETMGVYVFFRQQQVKISFGLTLLVTLIGCFYSSITPAATGGQPMQVLSLGKRGYSAGLTSSALAVKFFTMQMALLTMGGLLWIFRPAIVATCLEEAKWVVILGYFLNSLTVAAVLLLAINKNIVRGTIQFFIRIGRALRLIRDREKINARAEKALGEFHASVDMITHHPIRLLHLFLISCVQVLGLMSIAYCVYRALGLKEYLYWDILTLQFLLYIGASFTPLPGASGAQEGGFYLFFHHIIPADKLVGGLLLWRFFTYYMALAQGLGAVIIDSAGTMKRGEKKEKALQDEQAQDLG